MIKQKRGVSTVIATVMIIMITIVSAVLLAGFIVPFVKNNLEKSTECVPYQQYFSFEEKFELEGKIYRYNCYDSAVGLHGSSIRSIQDNSSLSLGNLAGFNLIFIENGGAATSVQVRDGENANSSFGGIRMLDKTEAFLEVAKRGQVKTYVYNAGTNKQFKSIEIYPVLRSGRVCGRTDVIKSIACSPPTSLIIN